MKPQSHLERLIVDTLKDMSDIPALDALDNAVVASRLGLHVRRSRFRSVFVRIAATIVVVIGFTMLAAGMGLFSSFKRALSGSGGKLRLSGEVTTVFVPTALNRDWYACEPKDGHVPDEKGAYTSTIQVGNAVIDVSAAFNSQSDGSLTASYSFVPRTDVELQALCVCAKLPISRYIGAKVVCDGLIRAEVPEKYGRKVLYNEKTQSFSIKPTSGIGDFSMAFDAPVRCFFQDDRTLDKPTLAIRLFARGRTDGVRYLSGERYELRFRVMGAVSYSTGGPVRIAREAGWTPVAFTGNVLPGSALDLSSLRPTGAKAGIFGRVVARNGHFEFANRPGVAQRFFGVNLNYSSVMPPEADADQIAGRLARLGYNAVRLHHHDGIVVDKAFGGVTLKEEKARRMDAFVAACSRHGIYVSTDLFVSRTNAGIPYRAVGIDRDGNVEQMEYKELLPFHRGVESNYVEFVRAFLGRINTATGVRYADDPTIAFLSLVNENEFGNHGTKYFCRHHFLRQAWSDWLAERRRANPVLYSDISDGEVPPEVRKGGADSPWARAFLQFAAEAERRFVIRVKSVIREELKCQALVTDLNGWCNRLAYQPLRDECLDYVDTHYYVDHPTIKKVKKYPFSAKDGCGNPVQNGRLGATGLAPMRIYGKPFVLTEFNYCAPGRFRSLGGLALGSMAALQDWAGLWRFTYGHDARQVANPAACPIIGCFNAASDPMSVAADKAIAALFLRGDLKPLVNSACVVIDSGRDRPLPNFAYKRIPWDWVSWYMRVGTRVGGDLPEGARALDEELLTGSSEKAMELLFLGWTTVGNVPQAGDKSIVIDPACGSFFVSSPCCAGGFAEHGSVYAGVVQAELSGGAGGVWAISLDGRPLQESQRLLVVHATDAHNTDAVFADGTMSTVISPGHAPMMARNGIAAISLSCAGASAMVFALADNGARSRKVPSRLENGRLTFVADVASAPDAATIFYEVVISLEAKSGKQEANLRGWKTETGKTACSTIQTRRKSS